MSIIMEIRMFSLNYGELHSEIKSILERFPQYICIIWTLNLT